MHFPWICYDIVRHVYHFHFSRFVDSKMSTCLVSNNLHLQRRRIHKSHTCHCMDHVCTHCRSAITWLVRIHSWTHWFHVRNVVLTRDAIRFRLSFFVSWRAHLFFSCSPAFLDPKYASYSWFIFSLGYFLPLVIITSTSTLILVKLKDHHHNLQVNGGGQNKKPGNSEKRERKVTWMVFLMNAAFISAWSTYAIATIIRLVGYSVPNWVMMLATLLAKSGAFVNPIIFVFLNSQVKSRAFLAIFDPCFQPCFSFGYLVS